MVKGKEGKGKTAASKRIEGTAKTDHILNQLAIHAGKGGGVYHAVLIRVQEGIWVP